jgi:TonB family protein
MTVSVLALFLSLFAGAAAPPAAKQAPLRISSVVMQNMLVHQVAPKYPESARKKNIQGIVKLDVIVGKDGSVKSVKVTDGQKDLGKAAVKAVKQWKYKPTLLQGKPVEVETTVDLQFHLTQPPKPAKPAKPVKHR